MRRSCNRLSRVMRGLIAIAVGLVLLRARSASADVEGRSSAVTSGVGGRQWTAVDVDYLARALMMEASSVPDSTEWAAIGWVAVNRALSDGRTIRDVVATTRWSGGGERGRDFVATIQSAEPTEKRAWPDALEFASWLLGGRIPNPIGSRRMFVHPRGMPRCEETPECDGARLCRDGRCLPTWIVARADGGSAKHTPVRQGRAVFAGAPLDLVEPADRTYHASLHGMPRL